jgi:ATP-dependent DNA helicase RecG
MLKALQSAIVTDSKVSKEPLEQKILKCIKSHPEITYEMLAKQLLVSRSTINRTLAKLTEAGLLERKGGKRYGHWEILDQ